MGKSMKPPSKIKRTDGRSVPVGGKPSAPMKGANKSSGKGKPLRSGGS